MSAGIPIEGIDKSVGDYETLKEAQKAAEGYFQNPAEVAPILTLVRDGHSLPVQ